MCLNLYQPFFQLTKKLKIILQALTALRGYWFSLIFKMTIREGGGTPGALLAPPPSLSPTPPLSVMGQELRTRKSFWDQRFEFRNTSLTFIFFAWLQLLEKIALDHVKKKSFGTETRPATGRENFACQDSGVSQIFILIISNGEKILRNINAVV